MYKESINDKLASSNWEDKALGASTWNVKSVLTDTHADNLRSWGMATPNFNRRKRSGELLPFTQWKQLENKLHSAQINQHVRRISDGLEDRVKGKTVYAFSGGDLLSPSGWTTTHESVNPDVIMQSVGAKASSSGWDVLTFAAEVGQVVNMFTGLITKVTRLLNSKPPGTPWNVWLEARYGWRTLAYDINDIEKAFSKIESKKFTKLSSGQSISWETTSLTNWPAVGGTEHTYSRVEKRLSGRGSVVLKGDLPRFNVNILKTAWEVTRLSFVVDWFVHIGRWIDALTFSMTYDYTAGYGTRYEAEETVWREFTLNPGWSLVKMECSSYRSGVGVTRGPASIPLVPLISVNLDTFKVFDLVAILIQAIRR